MVEQRFCKAKVISSNLLAGTFTIPYLIPLFLSKIEKEEEIKEKLAKILSQIDQLKMMLKVQKSSKKKFVLEK